MSTNIRFVVYNAYGIGGTVKTVFNFANYLQSTGNYTVDIISVKRTSAKPTLYLNPKIKITVIQDARHGVQYSDEDRLLLGQNSNLICSDEDLYPMFNAYTDKKIIDLFSGFHDGILVTTMPSFNVLSVQLVDDRVLKIGQEHKSYADHTETIQRLIRENYGGLDALTILTERNKQVYTRKIKGDLPVFVLGNGTIKLPFRASLKNHQIIAAGRYAPEKGYDMLIKAFGLIADRYPDWVLKIYGNGTLDKEYVKLIQKNHLENRVVLEPATNQLNEKLSESAFQVCSSYREGFGMSIIEGFAMGVPCISFACDGPQEIITSGYDGILVQKENVRQLSEEMKCLISDEEYRIELGKHAYETSNKFDIKTIGHNFEMIIHESADIKKRRPKIEKSNPVVQIVHETDETVINYSYDEMVQTAYEGNVGLKTIGKMLKGWVRYKVSKK